MSVFDIKDQVVVIKGGTGVLGREIGTYLAHDEARVELLGGTFAYCGEKGFVLEVNLPRNMQG